MRNLLCTLLLPVVTANVCSACVSERSKVADGLTPVIGIVDSLETPRPSFYRIRFHTSDRVFEATCNDADTRSCDDVEVESRHAVTRLGNLMRFRDSKIDTLDWTIVKESVR